jgi:hypothetical protein
VAGRRVRVQDHGLGLDRGLAHVSTSTSHGAGELSAEGVLGAALEADGERAAEGLAIEHLEALARPDRALRQVAQHVGIGVRDAGEHPGLPHVQLVQGARGELLDREVGRGDRVAVGIVRRVAQLGRDDLLELAREHVLEDLGLGVDPIPRDLEDLRQEELEQAGVADDLERDATAVGGQAHAAIGRVLGEPELVELAHHGRDRAGRDSSRSARALVATFAAPSWPSE